jgi:hypothetical protein
MFTSVKDRVARDKLVQDYLETKGRVKQKFVNEQLGQLDYQEDARKIFKPIIDSQDKTTVEMKSIVQEMPKALTYALGNLPNIALPSNELPAIDQAISLEAQQEKAIEYFMNNVDKNLNVETVRKYGFPVVSELISDPNNPDLAKMEQVINTRKGSITNEKSKLTRKINNTSDAENKATLEREYKELDEYGKQVNNAYTFFNKIKTGRGINYYQNPAQLFQRLCLLVSSKEAGNTGVNNEISEIIDELLETGVIDVSRAKLLYSKYL